MPPLPPQRAVPRSAPSSSRTGTPTTSVASRRCSPALSTSARARSTTAASRCVVAGLHTPDSGAVRAAGGRAAHCSGGCDCVMRGRLLTGQEPPCACWPRPGTPPTTCASIWRTTTRSSRATAFWAPALPCDGAVGCVLRHRRQVFEDLEAYMGSLARLLLLPVAAIYPGAQHGRRVSVSADRAGGCSCDCVMRAGHGPAVHDGAAKMAEYVANRRAREAQILAALHAPAPLDDIVAHVYPARGMPVLPCSRPPGPGCGVAWRRPPQHGAHAGLPVPPGHGLFAPLLRAWVMRR